jgi:hypothetical protein
MPQFIRHHVTHATRISWILPILTGLLIGSLLAFIAHLFLKEMRLTSNVTGVPSAASVPKPATELKKPVRYEAIKSNWEQYRANQPKE